MSWDEAELCAAIQAGDSAAEAELFLKFQARVRRLVDQTFRGGPDRDDLAAEILEGVLASLRRGGFRGDCRLGTFVHAVAKNKIAEALRRKKPETLELTEELGLSDAQPSVEERIARDELMQALQAALERLKPQHRQVLCLYFYQGQSIAEIAAALNEPARRISECKDYALRVLRRQCGKALRRFL